MRSLERNSATSNYVANSVSTVGGGTTGSRTPWYWIHLKKIPIPFGDALNYQESQLRRG